MVIHLVLRANVGEDYKPMGPSSCWTTMSPRGKDALERSVRIKQEGGREEIYHQPSSLLLCREMGKTKFIQGVMANLL